MLLSAPGKVPPGWLITLNPAQKARLNAIMAMGSTQSRAAIPILIDALVDPEPDASDRASYALRLLTHRTAVQDSETRNPENEYGQWSRWWQHQGATATLYKDSDCGAMVPLP